MEEQNAEATDIFLWANQTDAVKNNLGIELFLFNKLYTPFSLRYAKELEQQMRALFLYDVVNDINLGAGTGMSVRLFEESEAEDNVVLRSELSRVERAQLIITMIEKQRTEIVEFSEEEHEFKRMKGIVARFTDPSDTSKKPFYVVKLLQQSATLKGTVSWELSGGKVEQFKAEIGLKIPADNQVVIAGDDIFVFSQSKFERLFEYDYKKQLLADQKVAEIEKQYKLSFPEGVDLQTLVKDKKKIVKKLQTLELGDISQQQVIEKADDMQLEIMTDDAGAIIIMDGNDLDMFVNLISEDYYTSEITGKRFEIRSKKLLQAGDGSEPPRG